MSITTKEVLESIFILNHHAKDLNYLLDYLYFCKVAKNADGKLKYADLSAEKVEKWKTLQEMALELDAVVAEHYQVKLNAVSNRDIGKDISNHKYETLNAHPSPDWNAIDMLDEMLNDEDNDEILWEYDSPKIIKEDFIFPEMDFETMKMKVVIDKNGIYDLKSAFIEYAVTSGDKDLTVEFLNRQIDKRGEKYVGIKINEYIYHYPSEELYDRLKDVPITNYKAGNGAGSDDGEQYLYRYTYQTVVSAIRRVEELYHVNKC